MKLTKILTIALLGSVAIASTSCNNKVKAGISVDKTEVAVNDTVKFTNTSTNADTYEWDFGDGETSTEQSPRYSWSLSGTYKVKMTGCPKLGHGPARHFGGAKCATDTISIKVI